MGILLFGSVTLVFCVNVKNIPVKLVPTDTIPLHHRDPSLYFSQRLTNSSEEIALLKLKNKFQAYCLVFK